MSEVFLRIEFMAQLCRRPQARARRCARLESAQSRASAVVGVGLVLLLTLESIARSHTFVCAAAHKRHLPISDASCMCSTLRGVFSALLLDFPIGLSQCLEVRLRGPSFAKLQCVFFGFDLLVQ